MPPLDPPNSAPAYKQRSNEIWDAKLKVLLGLSNSNDIENLVLKKKKIDIEIFHQISVRVIFTVI